MRNRAGMALVACVAAGLCGCGGGLRTVTLLVKDGATGEPVEGAHLRAVSLDSGMAPLPVNKRTLAELSALGKVRGEGFSDAAGRVRLTLRPDVAHVIEADPPLLAPVGDDPLDSGHRAWVLAPDGAIEPAFGGADRQAGLRVEAVK